MHLVFERSRGIFKNNSNILSLAWMPYYDETKFRQALFEYHQRQLINLTSSIAANYPTASEDGPTDNNNNPVGHLARNHNARLLQNNHSMRGLGSLSNQQHQAMREQMTEQQRNNNQRQSSQQFLNSRIAELYQRYQMHFKDIPSLGNNSNLLDKKHKEDVEFSSALINDELDSKYGRMPDFGWLVLGTVGKIVGVTLTSLLNPPKEDLIHHKQKFSSTTAGEDDLMRFDSDINYSANDHDNQQLPLATDRPDRPSIRTNFNLRGHLDEVILVKWNELYQKLATVDSKGNVLIWFKVNEKFTIQTPFYNRTKSVADFKWSNDGKTALICYTDSFILVGSSSGQRHWHSMLNLDDYHITCASWTPNDEQLLLGVSNGNIVVIDLPHSELTELVVNQYNIRTMCWSSCDMNLKNIHGVIQQSTGNNNSDNRRNSCNQQRGNSTVVNHRRLSRDCSVFSRYRFCSQGPNNSINYSNNNTVERESPISNETNLVQIQTGDKLSTSITNDSSNEDKQKQQCNILAVDFANNSIKLYDGGLYDPNPKLIQVNQESYIMHWSYSGEILAVAGFTIHTTAPSIGYLKCRYLNTIKFYNQNGDLIYEHPMTYSRYPITAFAWAHDDKRVFVATGPKLHCAKVFFGIPPLNLLAISCLYNNTKSLTKINLLENIVNKGQFNHDILRWQSYNCPIEILKESQRKKNLDSRENNNTTSSDSAGSLKAIEYTEWNNSNVSKFELPTKLQIKIDQLFTQTIKQPFDEQWSLNDIIWHVPKSGRRHFCTLVCYTNEKDLSYSGSQGCQTNLGNRLDDDNLSSDHNKIFVLYVEFQGSLIPILRARRVGFLKPEFVIFDPEANKTKQDQRQQRKVSDISHPGLFINSGLSNRKPETTSTLQHQTFNQNLQGASSSGFYQHNDVFMENCSNLHAYSELKGLSSSDGRQSISDAEHYYNFGQDSSEGGPAANFLSENERILDGVTNNRSHHQEPMVLPMSNNPYIFNMLSLGHKQISQNRYASNGGAQFQNNSPSSGSKKQYREKIKPRTNGTSSSCLSETNELARVKSNIWGTKFKLINVSNRMIKYRSILASVIYKASILHLQPRQIFLKTKDMSNYCCVCSKHHHSRSTRGEPIKTSSNVKSEFNNQTSLLDTPNMDSSVISQRGKKLSSRKYATRKHSDNRVMVPVDDSIRIEKNQSYRFGRNTQNGLLLDDQEASTSRDNRQPIRVRVNTNLGKSQKANPRNHRDILMAQRTSRYTSSETHQSRTMQQSCSKIKSSNNLDGCGFDNSDDVLTLSMDQSENMKFEMSMSTDLDETDKRTQPKTSEGVDEFIATNKTLKSIQSITKMILDLSSKVDDFEGNDCPSPKSNASNLEDANLQSPSKLIKLVDDSNVNYMKSSNYVTPDAPVHRPRRVPASRLNGLLEQDVQFMTQSATTTPLKSSHQRRSRRAHMNKQFERGSNDSQQHMQDNPLPPPPPALPMSRRLSSTAKRLFDGSIRSFYGGSYSAANSDAEPEEYEPLVTGRRRYQLLQSNNANQPVTPVRSDSNRRDKQQSKDLSSIKSSFLKRIQGKHNERSFFAASTSQLDKYTEQVVRRFRSKRKGDDSSTNSSNSSLSDFSSSETSLENNSDLNLKNAHKQTKSRKQQKSASVRNLQELDGDHELAFARKRRERKVAFDFESEVSTKDKHNHKNRRRPPRRKSICSNNHCCCAREFKLSNRPPVWNELSQVYQLDFGGRVTQESAKNLQIDYEGNLVSSMIQVVAICDYLS